jgi:NADP-dependent 3-hydroxy acid dehydrogenase YdfG
MTERLEGTVALVTGASSGIGEATALALAVGGADVALVARRRDRLDDLAARIEKLDRRALVLEADVSDEHEVRRTVERTITELGRLDTVVANAGVMLLGPIVDADTAEWRHMVDLNVLGLMYTAHASLPHLVAAADGQPRRVADLVLVSSVAGRFPRLGSGAYNASKHAVTGFAEALRQEVAPRHVRVSIVEPGAVNTELASHNRPEIRDLMQARFGEMERMESEDIADTIAFIVTRPRRAAINEVLIRPTEQI